MSSPLIIATGAETKRVLSSPFGTFTFEKPSIQMYGQTHDLPASHFMPFLPSGDRAIVILPKHGDLDCPCNSCSAYRLVEEEKAHGWKLIDASEPPLYRIVK